MGTAFLAAGLGTSMAGLRTATGDRAGAEARGAEAGGAGRAAPGRAIDTGGRIGAPGTGPRAGGLAGRGAGGALAMPGIVGTERRIGSTRKTGGALGGRPNSAGAATGVAAAGADSWGGTLVAGLAACRGGRNACTGGLSGMPPRPGRIGEARLAGSAGGSAMCLDGAG